MHPCDYGGSKLPGADANATSKQCNLATALVLAREMPSLHFNAVTPGLIPTTGLYRGDAKATNILSKVALSLLLPMLRAFLKFLSTPRHAARVIAKLLTDKTDQTGIYYDERGHPMLGSAQVRDLKFRERIVSETRALLVTSAATR